jgi:hypothetical protein
MTDSRNDLDRFYTILSQLEKSGQQGLRLASYNGSSPLPARGVYFFREPGEYRLSKPSSLRIVRVGTHAVSANSKSTLWGRLKTHLGTRSGGGNHRGSIFRLHVGEGLLARDGVSVRTWGKGSSAPPDLRASVAAQEAESAYERKVSEYIGAMTVLWVDVPDEPGPSSLRAFIKRNAIALLSNRFVSIEPASAGWLGNHSPRDKIRKSSLWNLNHVGQQHDPRFLDELEAAIERTVRQADKQPTDHELELKKQGHNHRYLQEKLDEIVSPFDTDERLVVSDAYGDGGTSPLFLRLLRTASNQCVEGNATVSRYAIWANTVRDSISTALRLIENGQKEDGYRLLRAAHNSLSAFSEIQKHFDPLVTL